MPSPQQAAAPLRTLFDGATTLPALGGIGAVRPAGSGVHAPHVPAPQHAIEPLRVLAWPLNTLPSLGGIGSGRSPGSVIAAEDGAAPGSAAAVGVASGAGIAVGSAVASAVGGGAASAVPVGAAWSPGPSGGGVLLEQPIRASVSVAEMVFASSIFVPFCVTTWRAGAGAPPPTGRARGGVSRRAGREGKLSFPATRRRTTRPAPIADSPVGAGPAERYDRAVDSDRPTSPPKGPPPKNPATRLPPAGPGPAVSSSFLEQAYARARRSMEDIPAAQTGFRLFWVRDGETGWLDLPSTGAHVVLGRHTNCDVVLHGDPALSLRHLIATTIDLADGPALRLLDLRTAIPFHLADGAPRASIVASGPVAVRLGAYVIGSVPVEARGARPTGPVVPASLPPARVSEERALPRSMRPPPMTGPPQPDPEEEDDLPVSYVASMPPPAPILDLPGRSRPAPGTDPPARQAPTAAAPRAGRGPAEPSGPVCARMTLRREGRGATIELTEGELEVGVLVGRSDRCYSGGLASILDTSISRGHVLLLRQQDGFDAFDLASTQGTFSGGKRVQRARLSDDGTTLTLATVNPITLIWERAG